MDLEIRQLAGHPRMEADARRFERVLGQDALRAICRHTEARQSQGALTPQLELNLFDLNEYTKFQFLRSFS